MTALLRRKRVDRIWRRDGLKVPQKQPKRGRLWLNDGSCIRLRPEYPGHVWAYDFVEGRIHDGRKFRILAIIDEASWECMARPHQRPSLAQCRPPVPLRPTCDQHWPRRQSCTNNQQGPLSGVGNCQFRSFVLPNILVNGVKSKTGGGKSILQTYLRMANSEISELKYFVLTPDAKEYKSFESEKIKIIDIPNFAKSNIFFLLLYKYFFPKIINKFEIDAILNYGDIVIPGDTPQLYNFDWAYAAYPTGPSWDCLSRSERFLYRLKIYFFRRYLHSATIFMVQTDLLAQRIRNIYGLKNIEVVPNAVSLDNFVNRSDYNFNITKNRTKLLYITFYYPHKNIEIFIDIAREIKNRNLSYTLVTTLAPEHHPMAAKFLSTVQSEGLEEIICNIGPVSMHHVAPLFEQCDGLLMPTLLESFSGSYVEAMFHKKPIFTSDMDFARGVCGDAAFYFDPLDATNILATVEHAFSKSHSIIEMVDRGSVQLSKMWNWEQVYSRTQHLLVRLLNSR